MKNANYEDWKDMCEMVEENEVETKKLDLATMAEFVKPFFEGVVYGFAIVGVAWTIWSCVLQKKLGPELFDEKLMELADFADNFKK